MSDFARARRTMVDCQIRTNDVTESGVVDAFLAVPREAFVPPAKRALSYLDAELVIAPSGRFLVQPMILAKLIQAAKLQPTDIVLDIGAATGYSSAVMSLLCAKVVALESDETLATDAKAALADYPTVSVVTGALETGATASGPYDVIFIEGAVEEVPQQIFKSLKEGGRLLTVVGSGRAGRATLFVRVGSDFTGRVVFDAALPVLSGFVPAAVFTF